MKKEGIVANSMSGISGAGRNATEKLLYCERNESAGAYGLPKHRHLSEIEEQLSLLSMNSSEKVVISFHPHLSPMSRGICSTVSVPAQGELDRQKVVDCWNRSSVTALSSIFCPKENFGRCSCGGDQPDRSFGPRRLAYRQVCIVFGRGQPDQRSRRASHSVYERCQGYEEGAGLR